MVYIAYNKDTRLGVVQNTTSLEGARDTAIAEWSTFTHIVEVTPKKIIIDADSLLYRSAHINSDKVDTAQAEAEAIKVGNYKIATKVGGIPERPNITYENEQWIEASSEREALKSYNDTFDNEYWLGEVLQFVPTDDAEDIDLGEAEETNKIVAMSLTFHSMVNEIVKEVQYDAKAKGYEVDPKPVIVITVKGKHEVCSGIADNFRYHIMTDVEDDAVKGYKENRSGMAVPDGLNDLYEYVYRLEGTVCESGIEADDYCVYYGRKGDIVCALDKDVIGSLEYSYNYGKKEWIENYPEDIRMFPYLQTIMGDSSDGLRGVFRVGLKGAEKALADVDSPYEAWVAVVKQYYLKDQSLEEAIATMQCVRMSQWTEEHGLVLWQPPVKDTSWLEDL